MSIRPIRHPLPGERILALAPEDAAEAARWWLRRPNLFAGRTLTGPTLSARQDWAAAHVALRGRAFTAGVVQGLETALADVGSGLGGSRIALMQGSGLGASGEDVHVARAHEFELGSLPAVADPSAFSGLGGAALGLGLMARAGRAESLSGPLSRGLVAVTGLMALGYSAPDVGRHLPVATVGALVRGDTPGPGAALSTLALCALAAWVFDRSSR